VLASVAFFCFVTAFAKGLQADADKCVATTIDEAIYPAIWLRDLSLPLNPPDISVTAGGIHEPEGDGPSDTRENYSM
jgi:hypothetical protein